MRSNEQLSGLALALGATGLLGVSLASHGTENPVRSGDDSELGEVIVTGTRLAASPGFAAPTPVTVLDEKQLQRLGDTNVADVLNRLPAFRPSSTPQNQGFGRQAGVSLSLADLRGLGPLRTLVLVDGRRTSPTTTQGSVDLSFIPSSVVSRADVVTGGASAAYGSDAVAGVINLIFNNRFSGTRLQASYGLTEYGDNETTQFSALLGSSVFDGRGHMVWAAEYVDQAGAGDCFSRSYCSPDGLTSSYITSNTAAGAGGLPANVISGNMRNTNVSTAGVITSTALRGTSFNPDGSVSGATWDFGQLATPVSFWAIGGSNRNVFHRDLALTSPTRRISLYQNLELELTPSVTGFFNAWYGRVTGSGVSNSMFENGSITIRRDNAFLPAQIGARMDQLGITSFAMGRETTEFGVPKAFGKRSMFRVAAGLKGEFNDDWAWDAHLQHGRTDSDQRTDLLKITANFNRAMDSVRNSSGVAVCRSTLTDPTNGCSPFNPFGVGNVSAAAGNYAFGTALANYTFTEPSAAINVRGTLWDLPAGPLAVATGLEYRRDEAVTTGDAVSKVNGFNVGNTPILNGQMVITEAYAEANAPLLSQAPVFHVLELNGAIRRTRYERENSYTPKSSVNATTWKAGVVWEPISQLRLRATKSRDIRAPNMSEMFSAQILGTTFLTDPLTPTGTLSYLTGQFSGGNANLIPESADTTTLGVILQPSAEWLPGTLRLSADHYKIDLQDAIATLGANAIVSRCAAGVTQYCTLIARSPSTGLITAVTNQLLNLNNQVVRGIDLELNYQLPLSAVSRLPGTLGTRVLATKALELSQTDIFGIKVDRAGQNGNPTTGQSGVPSWTIDADLTYALGALSATAQVRHLTSGIYDVTLIGPEDTGYAPTLRNSINTNRVPGRTYLNLSGSYDVNSSVQVYGAVVNATNATPPVAPSLTGSFNTVLYDVFGRTYRAGVRVNF